MAHAVSIVAVVGSRASVGYFLAKRAEKATPPPHAVNLPADLATAPMADVSSIDFEVFPESEGAPQLIAFAIEAAGKLRALKRSEMPADGVVDVPSVRLGQGGFDRAHPICYVWTAHKIPVLDC